MAEYPNHEDNLIALRRIEGQVRGIQRMIEDRKYCIDILNQIHAVMRALARVEDKILEKHLENCVANAARESSKADRNQKFQEIVNLVSQFRKL